MLPKFRLLLFLLYYDLIPLASLFPLSAIQENPYSPVLSKMFLICLKGHHSLSLFVSDFIHNFNEVMIASPVFFRIVCIIFHIILIFGDFCIVYPPMIYDQLNKFKTKYCFFSFENRTKFFRLKKFYLLSSSMPYFFFCRIT